MSSTPTHTNQSFNNNATVPVGGQSVVRFASADSPQGVVVSTNLDSQPGETTPEKARFKTTSLILSLLAFLCIGAVAAYFILQSLNSSTQPDAKTSSQKVLQPNKQTTSATANIPQRLLYYKSTGPNVGVYTLTDQNNKVINQFNDKPSTLRALTDSGKYLLSQEMSDGVKYRVIDDMVYEILPRLQTLT